MAERVWRWVGCGLLLGLLPLLLAYVTRWYYAERPPTLPELLGSGDALLIVVTWSASALLELGATRRDRFLSKLALAFAVFTLACAAVAYGCLTADSVNGRVQSAKQARMLTTASLWGLAVAAAVGTWAAALAAPKEERSR